MSRPPRSPRRTTLALTGALTAAALSTAATLAISACEEHTVYIYTAAKYDEEADCVEPYSSIEQVPGEGASAKCSPRCMMVEGDLYVSTVCPPLPDGVDEVPADAGTCIAAVRALQRDGGTCAAGSSSGGTAAEDAGGDDAGERDAGSTKNTPDAAEPIKDAGPG